MKKTNILILSIFMCQSMLHTSDDDTSKIQPKRIEHRQIHLHIHDETFTELLTYLKTFSREEVRTACTESPGHCLSTHLKSLQWYKNQQIDDQGSTKNKDAINEILEMCSDPLNNNTIDSTSVDRIGEDTNSASERYISISGDNAEMKCITAKNPHH